MLATASINITTLVKIILFSSTCSVQLTCQPVNFAKFLRTPPVTASECSRNLEFEKRTDQNELITQNLRHGKEYYISKKKAVKTMSKGGYIWIYFGFCRVVVHFLGSDR